MGLDDLVGCIELLQKRIRAYEATLRENETRTRMALIDPLLKALGWNISDPGVVTPEYKVSTGGNRWADYALLRPDGKPAAAIEAKKLGTVLDVHRMQMLNNANASGIEYAGLTDGNNWELYTVFQPGPLEERRILEISIAGDPAPASALKLLLLWRTNLTSGEPVSANKPVLIDHPPAQVIPTPDSDLQANDWVPLSKFNPPPGTPCPTAIRFWDSSEQPLERWNQVLTSVVEKLYADGKFTAKDHTIGWSKKFYCVNTEPVHPTGKKFGNSKSIADGSLFVEAGLSAAGARRNAKRVLEHLGQNPAKVYLRVA